MPLYCSVEIFQGLAGAAFPATKEQLIEYAKQHDAPEAAVVVLNQLEDGHYADINDVCKNAGVVCSLETRGALATATFPATREQLLETARQNRASQAVIMALEFLPKDVPFGNLDDVCSEVT